MTINYIENFVEIKKKYIFYLAHSFFLLTHSHNENANPVQFSLETVQ